MMDIIMISEQGRIIKSYLILNIKAVRLSVGHAGFVYVVTDVNVKRFLSFN